jgi:hypothetical protein
MQKSKFGCWLAGSHSVTRILTGWENPNGIMDQRNLLHGWQILRQILISGCFFIHTHTTREKGSGCSPVHSSMQRSAVSNEKAAAA